VENIVKGDQTLERTSEFLTRSFGIDDAEAHARANELLATLAEQGSIGQSHRWWAYLVRGALAIVIGLLFLFRPATALLLLVLTFGVWVFIDGILAIGSAIETRGSTWRLWLTGIVGLCVGLLVLSRPALGATFLYIGVAVWTIVRGFLELSAAIHRRREAADGWLIASGLLSIAFGAVILFMPQIGVPVLAWLIGLYALVDGLLLLGLGLRIRQLGEIFQDFRSSLRHPEPRPT
jgi:uncharacterized membrane protein HdeD (DUF308 family)